MSRYPNQTVDFRYHESEQAVLGAILINPSCYSVVREIVSADSFETALHRTIFMAFDRVFEKCKPVDYLTTLMAVAELHAENLRRREREQVELADVDLHYLADLTDLTPSSANVAFYAERVRDGAIRRAVVQHANALTAEATVESAQSLIETITHTAARFSAAAEGPRVRPIRDVIREMAAEWDATLSSRARGFVGTPTGLRDLDHRTGGLEPGKLYVIGARSSHGKSSLAATIAGRIGAAGNVPSLFFTSEMSRVELVELMAGQLAKVNVKRIRRGLATDSEIARITETMQLMAKMPISIDDTPQITVEKIQARVLAESKAWQRPGVVFIDYLQRLESERTWRGFSREQQVSRIATALKTLARQANVPIVVLAQLSREVEKEKARRLPRRSDLRESGNIEQEADTLLLLWYGHKAGWDDPATKIDAILDKQRNGETGRFELRFVPDFALFEDAPQAPTADHFDEPDDHGAPI